MARVSELINPVTNSWDVHLVQQAFLPEDANLILQIPIHENIEDIIVWRIDKRSIFSCKIRLSGVGR
jgi:hypothetical protein